MSEKSCFHATIILEQSDAEALSTALSEVFMPSPQAVGRFLDKGNLWRVDAWFDDEPDLSALNALLVDVKSAGSGFTIETIAARDWVAESQAGLSPVWAGRFVIHGSHDRAIAQKSRHAIEIDAAQAFGTAHHASTRGCLLALDALAKHHSFSRILDIGTGTGILAIAAAKLWHAPVIASDIDAVACAIAGANAGINGVGRLIRPVKAAGTSHETVRYNAPYDLVIANILARPLVAMAADIAAIVRPGGSIVLSGITKNQAARVAAAYRAHGFTACNTVPLDDWATLVLQRRR